MRDQLVNLLELQTSDVKVRELDNAAKQLPAKLDPLRRDLAKLQGMLDAERAKMAETEAWRKSQQELLDRERDALKAAQAKLQASKNTKEFSAASREVENKRKSIGDREGELKKVIEATSAQSTQLAARDADVQKLRDELASSEAAMADQVKQLNDDLAAAKAARDAARAKVDKNLVKTYDTLAAKRGYAVAPVIKGTCQGCHMALPPQLNNILARMESIETCPRCGRLVYRKELIDPTPPPEEVKAEPPKKEKKESKPRAPRAPKPPKPAPVAATASDIASSSDSSSAEEAPVATAAVVASTPVEPEPPAAEPPAAQPPMPEPAPEPKVAAPTAEPPAAEPTPTPSPAEPLLPPPPPAEPPAADEAAPADAPALSPNESLGMSKMPQTD